MPLFPFSALSEPIEVHRLSNGLAVVLHRFSAPAIGLSFMIRCGPVFETAKNNGVSHFLEHMLFRGTPEYPDASQLSMALDRVGAEANAATFSDMTIVSIKLLPETLLEGLRLFRSMLTRPVFDGVTAERKIILEECLEDYDEEGRIIAIDQLSSQLLFGDHPYALAITGDAASVKRLGRKHLQDHLHRYYRPDAGVICIGGQIALSKALSDVRAVFSDWKNPAGTAPKSDLLPEPVFEGPRLIRVESPRSQVNARLSFFGLPFNDPDYFLQKALIRILDAPSGSPLRQAVQDKGGFCYSFSCGIDAYERAGALHIDLTVQPNRLVDALGVCLDVLGRMQSDGVDEATLQHMLQQYLKGKRFAMVDLWDFSSRYGFRELFPTPLDFPAEFAATLRLTPRALHRMIKRLFKRRNLGLTVVGPVTFAHEKRIRKLFQRFPE